MAPENELLSSWRGELRQQASQGSGREELEGGGEEQEGEIELLMQQEDRCDQINSRYLRPNIG